jgi:phage portal protein BeeE
MATLRERRRGTASSDEQRMSLSDVVEWKSIAGGGGIFPVGYGNMAGIPNAEMPSASMESYASSVYKTNGIVFACMAVRQSVFAEIRFRYANLENGKVGRMFGDPTLDVLFRPWPNGTTGELAARMIQDVDLAGNSYWVREGNRLYRRHPDKMLLVLTENPADARYSDIAGYSYWPDGIFPGRRNYTYLPEQVCHWSPLPDPQRDYLGMSWLTPVLREIASDSAATDHKQSFFRNGATPNMVVKTPAEIMTQDQFDAFKAKMDREHVGTGRAYKTLYLAPGADVSVVGRDFSQMDFGETQGRDETRIAAAAGVPAVIVGLKESMSGSSLNAGNYGQARRRFADGTMRPLYRSAAAALQTLVPPPNSGSILWYDDSQVAFFREDRADAADIFYKKALTVESLVRAGYEAETVATAVENEDLRALVHTGLFSVQLQKPDSGDVATGGA